MFKVSYGRLLLTAHLLLIGLLPGAYLSLLFQGSQAQIAYLAAAGAGLAMLLLFWVGTLLVRRLWQRKWVMVGALVLLLVVDGLGMCVGIALLYILGMAADPS